MVELDENRTPRNWGRWVLVGLFGCLGVALLVAVPPACVGYLVLRQRADTDAVEEAERLVDEYVRDARRDRRVTRVLGQPIRVRRKTLTTNFDLSGGELDAFVELRGPEAEGELHLRMRRFYGIWRIDEVRFEEMRSHAIDLLDDRRHDRPPVPPSAPNPPH